MRMRSDMWLLRVLSFQIVSDKVCREDQVEGVEMQGSSLDG